MLTPRRTIIATVIAAVLMTATASAALTNVEYFDFAGWTPSLIDNGPGQTFNVAPGVNVTVAGTGAFSIPSNYTVAGAIESGHELAGLANQFTFTFDTTLPIVFEIATLDPDENVDIIGVGPEAYHHDGGLTPNITDIPNGIGGVAGITLQGSGFGTDASAGEVTTQAQINQAVILRHVSLSANKFEFFRVGTLVPEPSGGMPLLGLLLLATCLRKRR